MLFYMEYYNLYINIYINIMFKKYKIKNNKI